MIHRSLVRPRLSGISCRRPAPADTHGTPGSAEGHCSASTDTETPLSVGKRCDTRFASYGAPALEHLLAYTPGIGDPCTSNSTEHALKPRPRKARAGASARQR
ncbi:hypothetical protein BPORC_1768 [Bifidobacterium porcinum]|nr:hypothetical protein BPORC_1768 [Bifidobacterium porcinum]